MQLLREQLAKKPVCYVSRDLERTLALRPTLGYSIISNTTPFAKSSLSTRNDIFLISAEHLLDTRDLLAHSETLGYLSKQKTTHIVVFKNTKKIEGLCQQNGWQLLNPPSALADQIEEKISQLNWLGDLTKLLPKHEVVLGKDLVFSNLPLIAQFNRAHTGLGTSLITDAKALEPIKQTFPNREVRVTQFIDGPVFTTNCVIWDKHLLIGNISYQITGLPPFTTNKFATIGNDWLIPLKILSKNNLEQCRIIATQIGNKLIESGWRGAFGLDLILDQHEQKMYLLEINARQPASTTYESELQTEMGTDDQHVSTFAAHLSALLNLPYSNQQIKPINNGAQIIKRVSADFDLSKFEPEKITDLGFKIIPYENSTPGSDQLRFQTKTGLMNNHQELNELGTKLEQLL